MYKYDPYTDRFVKVVDTIEPISYSVHHCDLTEECIEKIADAVVRKLADRKTEPIPHDDYVETENDHLEARCLNCHNAKACKENNWQGCRYEPQTDDFFRDLTAEERKAVAEYIESISIPTGVNVFDFMDDPQTRDTCKYGEDKHRYAHICNECGVGINNYKPKDEPQTERPCDNCQEFDCYGCEHKGASDETD